MNNTPLISLIIPCYNAEFSLEKCLKSVIEQDYPTLEIIIIDDGSTDNSSKIYEEFQRKDQRIKIIKQENAGVANARNKGIKIANGEYLCFVDSDDWVEKNYCSELYRLLISENADISIIEASYENLDGEIIFQKPTSSEKVFDGNRALVLLLEDKVLQSHPWGNSIKSLFEKYKFPRKSKMF
jgi:glycosyltransferase involved in cell wall biosynthesis